MNLDRQIRCIAVVLLGLFGLMFLKLNQLQVLDADKLANHPGNTRNAVRDFGRERGRILTADGRVVADTVPNPNTRSKFENIRTYPGGSLYGHITGFFSFTFGSTGIEREYNAVLAGREGALTFKRIEDLLRAKTVTADVTLTIVDALQREAAAALGRRRGSVVALDPRTGALLALVSFPTYDPTPLAGTDQTTVQAAYRALVDAPGNPLLARSYRERYPPGSTFKVISAATGLETGVTTLDTTYPLLPSLTLPLTTRPLRNFGGSVCGGTLAQSFIVSCNTSFAQLGLDVGAQALHDRAGDFGFNRRPPLDISPGAAASVFPDVGFYRRNAPALAQSAIGQSEVSATPLQMALVAAGIANDGEIRAPHLVREARDSDGNVIRRADVHTWQRAVSPEVAGQIRDMMVGVVEEGTGTRAALPGESVAAKTGTAQTGTNRAHAWIIGFAPADAPRVAVAVVVENQPEVSAATGGRIAAPILARVVRAALDG